MLIRIVGFFLIIITLCSCRTKNPELAKSSDSTNVFNPATEIKIGAIYSMTGDDAANNERGLNGTRLAVAEINRQGGIKGKKIFLQIYDDESSAAGAKECAKRAVNDSVLAIFGCSYSSHAMAAAPIAQNAKIPLIVHIATQSSITEVGDYIFRSCFINSFQSKLIAKFILQDLNKKKAAVIFEENNSYSLDLKKEFVANFENGGGKITCQVNYVKEDIDYSKPLNQILQSKPDIIFIPAYTAKSGMIIKQAAKMSIKATFVAGDGWSDRIFNFADSTADGSYYLDHWDPSLEDEVSLKFSSAYRQEYGVQKAPNSDAALAYDAIYLLAAAINNSGSFKRSIIRNNLQTIKFAGATGEISFDSNRNPAKQAVIKKVLKDSIIYFKAIKI